jgi:hypothetical protein
MSSAVAHCTRSAGLTDGTEAIVPRAVTTTQSSPCRLIASTRPRPGSTLPPVTSKMLPRRFSTNARLPRTAWRIQSGRTFSGRSASAGADGFFGIVPVVSAATGAAADASAVLLLFSSRSTASTIRASFGFGSVSARSTRSPSIVVGGVSGIGVSLDRGRSQRHLESKAGRQGAWSWKSRLYSPLGRALDSCDQPGADLDIIRLPRRATACLANGTAQRRIITGTVVAPRRKLRLMVGLPGLPGIVVGALSSTPNDRLKRSPGRPRVAVSVRSARSSKLEWTPLSVNLHR